MDATIRGFLESFIPQVSSEGAQAAFQQLRSSYEQASLDAIIARAFRIEIFLCKSFRQHGIASASHDEGEMNMAKQQMEAQLALLGNSSGTGVTEEHVSEVLVKAARLIVG